MGSHESEVDIIIVGGGLTGCALAARLKQGDASLEVTVLEAGPDPAGDPRTISFMAGFALAKSEMDWAFETEPQSNIGGRVLPIQAGKVLGGGSTVNYGGWARGDPTDYNEWARLVDDDRWSYAKLLPYFRRTETFPHAADRDQHGTDGPMRCTTVWNSDAKRRYGLREPLKNAWLEAGVAFNDGTNNGAIAGITEAAENFADGVRQPAHLAYDMSGVQVVTNCSVQKILLDNLAATGVLTADGKTIRARKRVIICTGAYRTPQLLMLSGIGPSEELAKHNIPVVVDALKVGRNFFDHFAIFQWWKLRHPEQRNAAGSPAWTDPALSKGLPVDWNVQQAVPAEVLQAALQRDGVSSENAARYQDAQRCHLETAALYFPGPSAAVGLQLPMDGSYVSTSVMLNLPTSRGRIGLRSGDVQDPPQIDANYFATAVDQTVLAYGVRRVLKVLLDTKAGAAEFEAEVHPPGMPALDSTSSEADIVQRIKAVGMAYAHPAGSAAMGAVVDSQLNVVGVQRLKVADYSIVPTAISGHPQATLYAIAEVAAEIIRDELRVS